MKRARWLPPGITNFEACVCDVEALEFPDASFDAVTVRIAPHHFLDIEKAVREIARVLKPGGVFVMEDSCVPESSALDGFINRLEKLRDATHVRSYSKTEWRRFLSDAGLRFVRLRNYRKTHDVKDWVERTGSLTADEQAAVYRAFAEAPQNARRHFAIQYDSGGVATKYTDDKVILKAVKRSKRCRLRRR